jgi:hypothetical protein
MQKLLKESIRNEIAHLKIFDCKAFSLLKKKDAFKRNEKMKSRTFINIDKIWFHQYFSSLKFKERRRK